MKNKKLRKILIIILIIIVFVGGIFAGKAIEARKYSEDESSTTTQISETTVSTQTIENTLTSSGEISSSETEKLDLSTSKYFKTMCVEENDIVKKGGKILKYSDGTYLKADYDCLISSYSVPETGSKCTSSNYVEVKNMKTLQLNISVAGKIKNCYNIGQLKGTSGVGGIIGNNENSSTATNSYYLPKTATSDYGNISENNYAKDKEFITTNFVNIANQDGLIWKVVTGENNGYPILIKTDE